MIVTRLRGGLGNQMFQYAAGRALALRTGAELKLDLGSYERSSLRSYALGPFPIQAEPATAEEVARLTRTPPLLRIARRLLGREPRPPRSRVEEPDLTFHPEVLDLPDGVYLDGYWQSERYFADAAAVIRAELEPPEPATARDRELAAAIDATESVSVHVRRGDYVSAAVAREMLGPCSLDYYRRATAWLGERIAEPALFVFSDEPEWVREHLDLPFPTTVVDHGGDADGAAHRDLALMSRCRHHVIANSSFSWWGAWLGRDPEGRVVAPERWFARADLSSRDLVPERWVRL